MKLPTLLSLLLVLGCKAESSKVEIVPGVQQVGKIAATEIKESSGIAASRKHADVFWTHNDHGSKPVLYAIKRSGELLTKYDVKGVDLYDWEDIAADANANLYLADIGNDARRNELHVYRVAEPDPKKTTAEIVPNRSWTLRFPGKPFDCESLFVLGTNAFVISKVFDDARAAIYRFPLSETNMTVTLELVAETSIESPVTSADVSNNGKLLGIVSKAGPFVYRIDGDVSRVRTEKPHRVKFKDRQIEACTFVPEGLLATSESREIYLFTDREFQAER